MEEIKWKVQSVLPTLEPTLLGDAMQHLTNGLGVETIDDLKYVEPSDLPMLKSIQVRKLVESWKTGTLNQSSYRSLWVLNLENITCLVSFLNIL